MAHLSQIGKQYRLRYFLTFSDIGQIERSRRFRKKSIALGRWPVAEELEEKTRYQRYTSKDIDRWKRDGLISSKDAEQLGFAGDIKTLAQAIEEYKQSWQVSTKEAKSREARLSLITSILGKDIYLKNLKYGDGLKLRNNLKTKGYKTATIQKCIQDLKRCLNLQVANQAIEFNPVATLSGGRILPEEKIEYVTLNDEQISEIINKSENSQLLQGWLKIFLLMFFGCGVRRNEALNTRWENIDWDERSLLLIETKTKVPRKVGIGQRLFYELLLRKQIKGPIFPHFHPDSVSKAIKKHFMSCGIKMRLHDTRHTYTSLIQQKAGAPPIEAMSRTGHKNMRMLSLYSHGKFGKIFEDEFDFMKVVKGEESEA